MLMGAGTFDVLSPEWIIVSPESYDSIAVAQAEGEETMHLEMVKSVKASGFFDDGIAYLFKEEDGSPKMVKPKHIHLEI